MSHILRLVLFYLNTVLLSALPAPTFTEGVTGQPVSFFPSQAESPMDKTISHLIYRGLFKYNSEGNLIPDLAESWEVSDDGLTYTVKLKPNMHLVHGEEITSDDLIYTAFKVPEFKGVATDKIDRYTVRYILPNKFSPFLSFLTTGIMPVNAEETQNPLKPISNGEFQVLSIKREGPAIREVVLQNKNKEAFFKKLVFRYYSNETELLTGAQLGEVDSLVLSYATNIDGFFLDQVPLTGVYYALFFNLDNSKFKSEDFRLKLAQTLPIEELTKDMGIPVQGPISHSPYTNTKLNFDVYKPNFVPEYLDKDITLIVPDTRNQKKLANRIARLWEEELGIHVTIKALDPDLIRESIIPSREFEVLLYGQQVGRDPDRYINWHSTQVAPKGLNIPGLKQVRVDRALEEGRKVSDEATRHVHYDDFQTTIMEQMPAIFLYHPYMNYYFSHKLGGITWDATLFSTWDRFTNFSSWYRRFLN